jgi:hypothetical protein
MWALLCINVLLKVNIDAVFGILDMLEDCHVLFQGRF